MATNAESKRRLRACRRLAVSYPDRTATDRLAQIADIASGEADPKIARPRSSPDLAERIAAGSASRAKGNAHDRIEREAAAAKAAQEEEKKRQRRDARDRQQRSGRDRKGG